MAVFGISTTWWTILYLQYTLFLRCIEIYSKKKNYHTILSSIIYHVIKNRYASPSIVILHHKHVCLFAHSDRLQQCNKQIDHIFICKYFVSCLFVVFLFALPSSFVYYNWELSKTLFILLQFLKESLASPVNGLLQ